MLVTIIYPDTSRALIKTDLDTLHLSQSIAGYVIPSVSYQCETIRIEDAYDDFEKNALTIERLRLSHANFAGLYPPRNWAAKKVYEARGTG